MDAFQAEPIGDDEERCLVKAEGKPEISRDETQQKSARYRFVRYVPIILVVALTFVAFMNPMTANWVNDEVDGEDGRSNQQHKNNFHKEESIIDLDNYGIFSKEEPEMANNAHSDEEIAYEAEEMANKKSDNEEEQGELESISQEPSDHEVQQLKALLNGESSEDDEQDEQKRTKMSGGSAPRTSTIPYNHMEGNVKYLIYNPSGGMSNQEIELVNAMRMAKQIGRTLYVPMVGKHSNFPGGYSHLGYEDLFPADRIWDFQRLEEFVPVIPLNVTLRKFLARASEFNRGIHQVRYIATDYGYSGRIGATSLRRINTMVIFLNGKGMWGGWWSSVANEETRKYVAYNPTLRRLAMNVALAHLGPRFYSIHGRLGDEMYKWDGKDSGDIFVRSRHFQSWDKSLKLYLASDDPNNAFFIPLRKHISVVTSLDLKGPDVDEYRNLFPTEQVRNDMFGVLDKLICSMGIMFLGSGFSTFSMEIRMIRAQANFVFPEWFELRHNLSMSPAEVP